MEAIISKLGNDKIKISQNKNPIKIETFLKFLNVEVQLSTNNLGYNNGWRERKGDNNLIISSGIIDGVDYLDSIQYGNKLANPWNNFINPFYMFDILNDDGKKFFIDYYKTDINKILNKYEEKLRIANKELEEIQSSINDIYIEAKL